MWNGTRARAGARRRSEPYASSLGRGAWVRWLAVLVVVATLTSACRDSSNQPEPEPSPEPESGAFGPRSYDIEWLIDAEAVGADGPGYPYRYREVVDDPDGRYLVQSPNHLAVQAPERVVFCAAIFRDSPYCASASRATGTPAVLSYPVQLLRSWGPAELYQLAGYRELELVAGTNPDTWQRYKSVVAEVPVDCFRAVKASPAAEEGVEICFIDDVYRQVASVDLDGDLVYEIDLVSYLAFVDDDSFVTGLESFIEEKVGLQDELLAMFPDIPAPRPTPTPDIAAELEG